MEILVLPSIQCQEEINLSECSQFWINHNLGALSIGGIVTKTGIAVQDTPALVSISGFLLHQRKPCFHANDEREPRFHANEKDNEALTNYQNEPITVQSSGGFGVDIVAHSTCDELLSEKVVVANDGTIPGGSNEDELMDCEHAMCKNINSENITSEIVSAMKGSREKQGLQLEKHRVTWAIDVYDPPCTSQSHSVGSHRQQSARTRKRSRRRKQNGNSRRGSSNSK